MSKKVSSTELRVGIFLAIAFAMAALAIFAVGEKSGLFEEKTTLYVYFDDISGLVEGANARSTWTRRSPPRSMWSPASERRFC